MEFEYKDPTKELKAEVDFYKNMNKLLIEDLNMA